LARARAQYGESELVGEATKTADLLHNVTSRRHERGARLHQMHRGTLMMHIKHAMLASGGIKPLWPVLKLNMGSQNWWVRPPKQLICSIMSHPGTMNAEQDFINCIEGLCMMHIKHAMLASGGIKPLWLVQGLNMGSQNWWVRPPKQLICSIMSPPGTMNAEQASKPVNLSYCFCSQYL